MDAAENHPLRVLVVDDGRDNRAFVVDYILKPNGYFPLVARDGVEGMDAVRRYRPDLILLDLQMPRMDGLQMLDALQEEGWNIPVILMTFHGSEEIAVEVYRKGVRDYVKKPYTVEEMLSAMDRCLSEVRLRNDKEALTRRLLAANTELNRRVREMGLLFRIGKSVSELASLDQLMLHIVDTAARLSGAEQVSLLTLEASGLVCRVIKRPGATSAAPVHVASTNPVALHVVKNGRPLVLTVEMLAARRAGNPEVPLAALAVPLRVGDRVIGVLLAEIVSGDARDFSEHEGTMLEALADYGAIALENARVHASLREAARAQGATDQAGTTPGEAGLHIVGVLAGDLRGMVAFVDSAGVEDALKLAADWGATVSRAAARWNGIVSSGSGAAFTICFDGGTAVSDCARRAVEASLYLCAAAPELLATVKGGALSMSMGAHMGEAVVGPAGALGVVTLGEASETAQRLLARAAPGEILITEAVRAAVGEGIRCDPADALASEGEGDPVPVYRLLGMD